MTETLCCKTCVTTRWRRQILTINTMQRGALFFMLISCLPRNIEGGKNSTTACPCDLTDWIQPELWKKAETARWMSHVIDWGVLSTQSSNNPGYPFGNPYSFVDGTCGNATGTPYFFGTFLDQSFIDMRANNAASFTLSEASMLNSCTSSAYTEKVCKISTIPGRYAVGGDPESPLCARLTLVGSLELVSDDEEFSFAKKAFYQRHPQMKSWPENHDWNIAKLVVNEAWLIDYFGGASILTADEYYKDVSMFPTQITREGNRQR